MPDQTLMVNGEEVDAYFAEPARSTGRAVVVLHELYGLLDDIRRISDRFAANGYLAVAPNLYQGLGPRPFCMARAMRALAAGGGPILDRVEALADHLGERPDVDRDAVAVAGFCMGGGFAVLAAGRGHFAVAAPFYGNVPRTRRRLPELCPTVASFGGRDLAFRDGAERLEQHLREADVPHDVKLYEGVGHSFMSIHPAPLRPLGYLPPMYARYDEAAAEDAWDRMLGFFDTHLPVRPV